MQGSNNNERGVMPSQVARGGNALRGGPMPQSGNTVVNASSVVPNPPESLGKEGRRRWSDIANILVGRKTWSLDWLPALEHLCRSYDNLKEIDEALAGPYETMTVASTNGRSLKCNPLLDYRLKVEAFIESQLNYFGLTPMSSKGIFVSTVTDDSSSQRVRQRDRKAGPQFKEDQNTGKQ